MSIPTDMLIAITQARAAAEGDDRDVEDRLRAAMKATRNHWMCRDEDAQFRSACAGVLLVLDEDDPDRTRIRLEMETLRNLSLLIEGAPLDVERAFPDTVDPEGFIGLMQLWTEAS